jgi:hypothetical protein
MPPSADKQIQFRVKLERLLDEGQFTASYKFALLLALADFSIEAGDDSGGSLPITTEQIAGKFIQYWRQAAPYVAPAESRVLQQNTGKQAAVVNIVEAARNEHGDSLAALMNNAPAWKPLVREVAGVVRVCHCGSYKPLAKSGWISCTPTPAPANPSFSALAWPIVSASSTP